MTINGIWDWANQVAQKVSLETLRGKTLSIDGHIWLYESLKGCETHHQQTPNSYLVTFFSRLARLKELKINPIVVFDSLSANGPLMDQQEEFVTRKKRGILDSPFTNLVDYVLKLHSLLDGMGVRVIFAPGDGEAQCARLEEIGETSGCITTDFDYFLFGGRNLYRFDFTQSATLSLSSARLQDVTHLSLGKMSIEKKIARPHLISTAILLGCDYFQRGVQGVGIVTVFDILSEFGDDGSEDVDAHVILDRFTSYVREEIPARSEDTPRKLRLRRKTYHFQEGFPNCESVNTAIRMYLRPPVNNDPNLVERVFPASPDSSKLMKILMKECGWTAERLHKELDLSVKRTNRNNNIVSQTRIPEFFATTRFTPLVEQCKSVDEYISASTAHRVRKRKQTESPAQYKVTPKRIMLPVDTGRRRTNMIIAASQRQPYPDGVIELGDSD